MKKNRSRSSFWIMIIHTKKQEEKITQIENVNRKILLYRG
jgi:hypothetical protein